MREAELHYEDTYGSRYRQTAGWVHHPLKKLLLFKNHRHTMTQQATTTLVNSTGDGPAFNGREAAQIFVAAAMEGCYMHDSSGTKEVSIYMLVAGSLLPVPTTLDVSTIARSMEPRLPGAFVGAADSTTYILGTVRATKLCNSDGIADKLTMEGTPLDSR
jgi:hypothetical protein